jgi:hypothetical protein
MTEQEFINYADANKEVLIRLINNFHPVNRQPNRRRETINQKGDFITAPNVEMAITPIRKEIKENYKGNPSDDFLRAIVENKWEPIYKILNETWMGVPESTNCWQYDGFREAVYLLEDWPETNGNDTQADI